MNQDKWNLEFILVGYGTWRKFSEMIDVPNSLTRSGEIDQALILVFADGFSSTTRWTDDFTSIVISTEVSSFKAPNDIEELMRLTGWMIVDEMDENNPAAISSEKSEYTNRLAYTDLLCAVEGALRIESLWMLPDDADPDEGAAVAMMLQSFKDAVAKAKGGERT